MKNIRFLAGLLVIVFGFISCDPDEGKGSAQNDDAFAEHFGSAVSKDFIGQVTDADNHPLQGVTVSIGSSSVQTDSNGVFIINGASVHEKLAYIQASKTGYFDGSRALVPTSGKNNVKIMLVPNAPLQTIQSGANTEVSLPSGTKVSFDGAFQDENGAAYSGTVVVSLFSLSPSNENIYKLMPGMLYAQTSDNKEAVLQTFGMLNVELRGSAGQKLNIASGHKAEITMKIDESQSATAPNTIPLWHFEQVKGYWKEDGEAHKEENNYVGQVSHFSWWNFDLQVPTVSFTARVIDSNGNPIPDVGLGLQSQQNGPQRIGFTDSQGFISGFIPSNVQLILNVYPNYFLCTSSTIAYTSSIGPFAQDATLPDIVIANSPSTRSATVVGTLLNCAGANVSNGYVTLTKVGGYSNAPVINGVFSFTELYCDSGAQFSLNGVDYENRQQTTAVSYNFTAPVTNVGNLQTCNTIDSFISYQVDNGPAKIIIGATGTTPANRLQISHLAAPPDFQEFMMIGIPNTNVVGLYDMSQFDIRSSDFGELTSLNSTIQIHLNQIGTYVDMTCNGTFSREQQQHTISILIHARR